MYNVSCACGSVQLAISKRPLGQSWCHCTSCKSFHQTTPVPFALFEEDAVQVQKGSDAIKQISLSESNFWKAKLKRHFCGNCGFHVYNQPGEQPFRGLTATSVGGLEFQPTFHGFCKDAERRTLLHFGSDGLPKYKDQPKDGGGSGETCTV